MEILSLEDVSEVTMVCNYKCKYLCFILKYLYHIGFESFGVDIYLYQTWNDERLRLENISFSTLGYVALHPSLIWKIWLPDTYFSNVKESINPSMDDDSFSHKCVILVSSQGYVQYSQRSILSYCI